LLLSINNPTEKEEVQKRVNELNQEWYVALLKTFEVVKSKDPLRFSASLRVEESIALLTNFINRLGTKKTYLPHKTMSFIVAKQEEWFQEISSSNKKIHIYKGNRSKKKIEKTEMEWSIAICQTALKQLYHIFIHLREPIGIPEEVASKFKTVKQALNCTLGTI